MNTVQERQQSIIKECRDKLLAMKSEILNRSRFLLREFRSRENITGDEADMVTYVLAEQNYLREQGRLQTRLIELDQALERILRGTFGICEETEEQIEAARLLAVPWTTLSIEGAEMREARQSRFAK
ncbi:MAG: TraR/DksA C4-type zinc finger protein [Pseudomonadota bacterium]|nr:TraR/DksA C4-type zinc finger protein [Pseudomonadota bacterium]